MSTLPPLRGVQAAYIDALTDGDLNTALNLENQLETTWQALEARLAQPGALQAAALYYAKQGHPVFPLQPGSKQPFPGSRGFKDATTNTEQIKAWWQTAPDANIGLATGHTLDVIDCDGAKGLSNYTWQDFIDDDANWQLKAAVRTPHGLHYWCQATGIPSSQAVKPGVDLRGTGGYVVAPPSQVTCSKQGCRNPFPHLYRFLEGYELS